jgi:hypothetical protein
MESTHDCWIGRRNWNIPKHPARFTFEHLNNPKRLKVQVFPPDTSIEIPFFTATLQPFTWTPSFTFSSKVGPYLGMNTTLTQPPVPASEKEGEEEIAGTNEWLRSYPVMTCKRAQACWVDVQRQSDDEHVVGWWPKVKPLKIGLWMENSILKIGVSEVVPLP